MAGFRLLATLIFIAHVCAMSTQCTEKGEDHRALLQTHSTQSPTRSSVALSELPPSRVAVVQVVKTVTSCHVLRAQSLAMLTNSGYDVWFLHSPSAQDPDLLSNLTAMNIKCEAQEQVISPSWQHFGSPWIGFAMAAFLKFTIKHSEYDFVWHLEDDVYFKGNWTGLFTRLQSAFPTESLLARMQPDTYNATRMALGDFCRGHCRLARDIPCTIDTPTVALILGSSAAKKMKHLKASNHLPGNQPAIMKTWWMMARVSHEYAVKLGMGLDEENGASGNHECLAAAYCSSQSRFQKGPHSWCTMAELPEDIFGTWVTGHNGKYSSAVKKEKLMQQRLWSPKGLSADKLYHPVKCHVQ